MKLHFLMTGHDKKARLEYIIQFISNTLGYPWEIITAPVTEVESGILVSYFSDYSECPVRKMSGINIYNSGQLYDLTAAQKEITSINYAGYSIPVLGKLMRLHPASGWKEDVQFKYYSQDGVSTWLTGFDLFANIFYHISRFEERGRRIARETIDDHSSSILACHHPLSVPVVDIMIDYFDQLIKHKINEDKRLALRIMNWPGGEECGVALTHDIDLTRAVSIKKRLWKTGLALVRKLFADRESLQQVRAEMNRQDARVWNYPHVLDFYSRKKWKATFFFLAKIFEGLHYRYNIKKAEFQVLFDTLKNENHEIGLHSSLNAFKHQKKYAAEKNRLEIHTSVKCAGLRQHYLRALYPQLWEYAEAAHFAYDSSLGYNYQPGFRAGTTHPFFTFDYHKDQPLGLVEFSLAFFEHNLLTGLSDLSTARQIMQTIITQVNRFRGLLVILWHTSNFLHPSFHELWKDLIAELDKCRIYVDTLSGHYKWFKFKQHIEIQQEKGDETEEIWIIKKPIGLRIFSIEIIGPADLYASPDVQIEKIAGQSYTIHSDKTKLELRLQRL
jgi:peptidoglycan/xylan/chitin deacetylase (PgdA/CDA1 family)